MSGVTLNQVIKKFGETQVIHGVDLDIKDGELCVFVGPSGCGKSTLLRMIAGLEQTSAAQSQSGIVMSPRRILRIVGLRWFPKLCALSTYDGRRKHGVWPKDEWRTQGCCARKGVGSRENPEA